MSEIKFLEKNERIFYGPEIVKITITGRERSKTIRFSFGKDTLDKITKTGYINFSLIDENSDAIYFKESNKEEGYKIVRTKHSGYVLVLNRGYVESAEKYNWVGSFELSKRDEYYCIIKKPLK